MLEPCLPFAKITKLYNLDLADRFYNAWLRVIHTRHSGLHFLQWAASTQRLEIFYLPAETQSSAQTHMENAGM